MPNLCVLYESISPSPGNAGLKTKAMVFRLCVCAEEFSFRASALRTDLRTNVRNRSPQPNLCWSFIIGPSNSCAIWLPTYMVGERGESRVFWLRVSRARGSKADVVVWIESNSMEVSISTTASTLLWRPHVTDAHWKYVCRIRTFETCRLSLNTHHHRPTSALPAQTFVCEPKGPLSDIALFDVRRKHHTHDFSCLCRITCSRVRKQNSVCANAGSVSWDRYLEDKEIQRSHFSSNHMQIIPFALPHKKVEQEWLVSGNENTFLSKPPRAP